jgi:N-acetylmuramoyl-L-alanine amidase
VIPRRAAAATAAIAIAAAAACGGKEGPRDPANELPFGAIDVPVEGAQVKAQAPIAGWALDDRGIAEIRIYVDAHIVSTGQPTIDRPDVSKAFPQYARGNNRHGWNLTMAFDTPGPHAVLVQAVDTDGATRDIASLKVIAVEK